MDDIAPQMDTACRKTGADFRTILFGPDDVMSGNRPRQPDCFCDLNLDQVVAQAVSSKEEYDLEPFFFHSLRNTDVLAWRHAVFQDCQRPEIARALRSFAERMRRFKNSRDRMEKYHDGRQRQAQLLVSIEIYCGTIEYAASALAATAPMSAGLGAFVDWLHRTVQSSDFALLRQQHAGVRRALEAIRYKLLIHGDTVRVSRCSEADDYSKVISAAFAKFAQAEARAYEWKLPDYPELNHVEAGILDHVVRLYPEPFRQLARFAERWADFADPVVLRFDREIQFYLAWLECIEPLQKAGIRFVLPEFAHGSKEESVTGACDMALALKRVAEGGEIVPNDFHLSGAERVIVVTGPNQGGKTTFARMFGQIHWLASLGLPVPAEAAKLVLFDRLFTHFEQEESVKTERGKLEDEVARIHDILHAATSDSLVVINEIFASTSVNDALALATDVMEQIIERKCLAVCVTFLDEISRLGPSVVSYASTVLPENPAERTYKIIRQPASGNAYAVHLARWHGLTKPQILKRIAR